MQTKMNWTWPEASLSRILEAFEQEILESSEEEIMEAAKELGMNPAMKGSAAFMDLKYAFGLRGDAIGDAIYDMHSWSSALDEKMASEECRFPEGESPASKERKSPRRAKEPDDK